MYKSKIFSDPDFLQVVEEFNEWFKKNPDIDIIDLAMRKDYYDVHIIRVKYKEKEKNNE